MMCPFTQRIYDYMPSERDAKKLLKETRCKSHLSKDIISQIDKKVTPLVKACQSIHHIYYSDDFLMNICSEITLRRMIYRGELTCKPHELRRYVRFKKPKPYIKNDEGKQIYLKKVENLIGRTFEDYIKYKKANPGLSISEYDSVIGKRDDRLAILTITFPLNIIQVGLLIDKGSPESVLRKVKSLIKKALELEINDLFSIMLSDNGTEFQTFYELEKEFNSVKVFYTRPNVASDKPHCERNHELVRYLFPSGKSFDNINQKIVNEAFSHINSYIRGSRNNKTPYDNFVEKYGEKGIEFLNKIGIKRIENKKVRLKPLI